MKSLKLYKCDVCGELIAVIEGSSETLTCCGQLMKEIKPKVNDFANEKHLPVVERKKDVVTVFIGSIDHPMESNHYIEWVLLQTNKGIKLNKLCSDDKPMTKFILCPGERVIRVYAYCNIHGLWVKEEEKAPCEDCMINIRKCDK